MSRITLERIGPLLKEKRGNRGIRAVAAEIGISPATLSRVESGKQPDLDTFAKLCQWLGIDAGEVLGCRMPASAGQEDLHQAPFAPGVFAHFRAEKAMKPETAQRLGELIMAVQQAVEREIAG
jgi:transcriptional regulator with XRE-family HTH domain